MSFQASTGASSEDEFAQRVDIAQRRVRSSWKARIENIYFQTRPSSVNMNCFLLICLFSLTSLASATWSGDSPPVGSTDWNVTVATVGVDEAFTLEGDNSNFSADFSCTRCTITTTASSHTWSVSESVSFTLIDSTIIGSNEGGWNLQQEPGVGSESIFTDVIINNLGVSAGTPGVLLEAETITWNNVSLSTGGLSIESGVTSPHVAIESSGEAGEVLSWTDVMLPECAGIAPGFIFTSRSSVTLESCSAQCGARAYPSFGFSSELDAFVGNVNMQDVVTDHLLVQGVSNVAMNEGSVQTGASLRIGTGAMVDVSFDGTVFGPCAQLVVEEGIEGTYTNVQYNLETFDRIRSDGFISDGGNENIGSRGLDCGIEDDFFLPSYVFAMLATLGCIAGSGLIWSVANVTMLYNGRQSVALLSSKDRSDASSTMSGRDEEDVKIGPGEF